MTTFLGSVIAMLGFALTEGLADETTRADAGPRPNIVFLYTDDQAQWAMGAYGNHDIKTPHLDGLARSGVEVFATRLRSLRSVRRRGLHS